MIPGRPSNLVLGAFTALFNVIVLLAATQGYPLTAELVAAINLAAAAVITLIANQTPTVVQGASVNVITPEGVPNKVITAN